MLAFLGSDKLNLGFGWLVIPKPTSFAMVVKDVKLDTTREDGVIADSAFYDFHHFRLPLGLRHYKVFWLKDGSLFHDSIFLNRFTFKADCPRISVSDDFAGNTKIKDKVLCPRL